jgi:hypothetical protein
MYCRYILDFYTYFYTYIYTLTIRLYPPTTGRSYTPSIYQIDDRRKCAQVPKGMFRTPTAGSAGSDGTSQAQAARIKDRKDGRDGKAMG